MLKISRHEGKATCRVIARDLHGRVVGDIQVWRMRQTCSVMWRLWREQGSLPDKIIHETQGQELADVEIEFQT